MPLVNCSHCDYSYFASNFDCPRCGTENVDAGMINTIMECFRYISAHPDGITPEARVKLTKIYDQTCSLSDEIFANSKDN